VTQLSWNGVAEFTATAGEVFPSLEAIGTKLGAISILADLVHPEGEESIWQVQIDAPQASWHPVRKSLPKALRAAGWASLTTVQGGPGRTVLILTCLAGNEDQGESQDAPVEVSTTPTVTQESTMSAVPTSTIPGVSAAPTTAAVTIEQLLAAVAATNASVDTLSKAAASAQAAQLALGQRVDALAPALPKASEAAAAAEAANKAAAAAAAAAADAAAKALKAEADLQVLTAKVNALPAPSAAGATKSSTASEDWTTGEIAVAVGCTLLLIGGVWMLVDKFTGKATPV